MMKRKNLLIGFIIVVILVLTLLILLKKEPESSSDRISNITLYFGFGERGSKEPFYKKFKIIPSAVIYKFEELNNEISIQRYDAKDAYQPHFAYFYPANLKGKLEKDYNCEASCFKVALENIGKDIYHNPKISINTNLPLTLKYVEGGSRAATTLSTSKLYKCMTINYDSCEEELKIEASLVPTGILSFEMCYEDRLNKNFKEFYYPWQYMVKYGDKNMSIVEFPWFKKEKVDMFLNDKHLSTFYINFGEEISENACQN